MRIIEEEKIMPATEPADQPIIFPTDEKEIRKNKARRRNRPHRRHSCFKLFLGFLLMLAVIFAILAYLIFYIAGPLVKAVDGVPTDFPKDLTLYGLDQAEVKIQLPENKRFLLQLINGLPDWSLLPFLGYLTNDLKTQIAAKLQNPNNLPANLSVNDLKNALDNDGALAKTVGLEWTNLDKTKEDLFDYYKKQLTADGFIVKEKLSDYEIDLSFFKPGIDGAMSITDSFMKDDNSIIKMTINYLSGI